ncbi:MAG: DUF1552 domain-containing protein [Lentisphaeraceae bacterium]|nr:DUF1552 domain-containing protein [Lentisphaeraceae bacterium]
MNLSRRTILKGASGLAMSLPWLEAVADSKKAAKAHPRLAFMFMPNGVHPERWNPKEMGKLNELSPILKPLDPVKDQFDVLTNLNHKNALRGDGHYAKTANFISGEIVHKTAGKDIRCGLSADQIIARHIGKETPLPSIELGIEATRTNVDTNVGFTQVYGGHISWSSDTTPTPKEIYPQLAFDRLFNNNSFDNGLTSVLDGVKEDAKKLNDYISVEDRVRMDAFFTSVRSLEKRIVKAVKEKEKKQVQIPHDKRPADGLPDKLDTHFKLMLDIIVLAFQMNRTNVVTFMFGNSVSGKNFSFLDGVQGGFHQLSHHAGNHEKLEMYSKINVYHMMLFSRMLQQMKSIKEGDKTLLDNSLIMLGSGLRDGNKHEHHNLPMLIAGKGGQNIQRGFQREHKKDTPLSNLVLGMIQASGVEMSHFGGSNGVII